MEAGILLQRRILPPRPVYAQWMTLDISNEGGATDLVLRSDGEDPSTEVTVASGHGFAIATAMPACQNSIRFQPGKPAAYLKAASGGTGVGAYLVWS